MDIHYKEYLQKSPKWLRDQALIFLCLLFGSIGVTYFGPKVSSYVKPPASVITPIKQAPAVLAPLPHSLPTHLSISKIGVNASVVSLGLKANGTMYTPAVPEQAGWYKHSPTPGQLGPAVIVGHVDSPKGPAVFWRLGEMQPGDIAEVARADGSTARFKVDAVKEFPQNNFPTQEVYGNTTYPALRLITCSGTFNSDTGRYSNNTVVFASLVR